MMKDKHTLEQVQDLVQELGNIGLGCASTALSVLLHTQVKASTQQVVPLDQIFYLNTDGMNEQVLAVLFPYDKKMQGFALFLLEQAFVEDVLQALTHQSCDVTKIQKDEYKLLQEVTGIMVSAYLAGIAEAIHLPVRIHLPAITLDMRGSIINDALSFLMAQDKEVLLLHQEFQLASSSVVNHLMFLISQESILTTLHTLEVAP